MTGRTGSSGGIMMMPYETFKCADGHLIVACGNNSQWQSLCAALARDDLASDPRLATPSGRQINRDFALDELPRCFSLVWAPGPDFSTQ